MSLPGLDDLDLSSVSFDTTLGPLQIGGLLAMALWGVTCIQTYTFFNNNSRDRPVFKVLIAGLFAADTAHAIVCCHIVYHYMVTNYANPMAILVPDWSVICLVTITSISDFLVRSLFTRRVYRLSGGNIPVTMFIAALSIADLVCGMVITVRGFQINTFLELDQLSILMYLNFTFGTSSDLAVAFALCYWLYLSRTGLPRTNSLINTLMAYSINTGLIVAIDAALGVILYGAMHHNLVFLAPYMLLSKLYLNSYIATLNARESLKEWSDQPVSIHFTDMSRTNQPPSGESHELRTTAREKRISQDIAMTIMSTRETEETKFLSSTV